MKLIKYTLLFLITFCFGLQYCIAQKEVTTFGLQFKPIISSEIINTGPQVDKVGDIGFEIAPNGGFGFGMVIRKGFTEQLSLETGINYTKRNFNLTITEDSTNFRGESDFKYVIYEIPVTALVYVQMGKETYLNTSFGMAFNFLPSDWESGDNYFYHRSFRKRWIVPSLLANVGFEYRTYDKGFFYFGFSYHRPFSNITTAGVVYKSENEFGQFVDRETAFFDISGNYLTIDLRYFFHEDPENRKKRRR